MSKLFPTNDPSGLLEYSVVYTDRALNHMSQGFQGVMRDISGILKEVYKGKSAIVVPGSGTFGMEAVARQFATGKNVLVLRNGWFSYRWTQIFEMGNIPASSTVLKAQKQGPDKQSPYAPAAIEEVVATILRDKPDLVFAPHVETASGIMLPDSYLRAVADAIHSVGGMFVLGLHCIGCDVGGHGSHRCGCAGQRATKGLDRLARLRLCGAFRIGT